MREREARLMGDLLRTGREKTKGEREKAKLWLWSLGCAACRLLLDPFLGGFGGTSSLAGQPFNKEEGGGLKLGV
jgi:hypothetical protein